MSDIKAGDVVKLKSGSIPMTVEFVAAQLPTIMAHVIWMTEYAERRTAMIAAEALDKCPAGRG
jgi:uncharacterized protein YodC (DUF2158 family)